MIRHISTTDQAKMIRKALKEAFGNKVKFSVRQRSGGSINVSWENGPVTESVNKIVKCFEGGYFDGMTDYHGSYSHKMNGETVSFSASFIFVSRTLTDDFIEECKGELETLTTLQRCNVWNKTGSDWIKRDIASMEEGSEEYSTKFATLLAHASGIEALPSPTAESLSVIRKY